MNTNNFDGEAESQDTSSSSRNLTTPPSEYPSEGLEYLLMVCYGKMQQRGLFRSRTPGVVYGDNVVVQSERGIEIGEVALDVRKEGEKSGEPLGWVLRLATAEDLKRHSTFNEPSDGPGPEFLFCMERIEALELPMRLVDVERPFGGGKIIFYFTADGRVDFRMLVRDLAKRYRTRIEMKQIGVRDEAKVLGDVADCGRELCCRSFLTKLQPISMRMAKVQKTTLDPAKISGRCGRLKCCLRYEYDTYLSLKSSLPRLGTKVRVEGRPGVVVGMDVLGQEVNIQLRDGERVLTHVNGLEQETSEEPMQARPGTKRVDAARDTRGAGKAESKGKEPESSRRPPGEGAPSKSEVAPHENASRDSGAGRPDSPGTDGRPPAQKQRLKKSRGGRRRAQSRDSTGTDRPPAPPEREASKKQGKQEEGVKRGRRRRRRSRPRKPRGDKQGNSGADRKSGGGGQRKP